MVRVTRSKKVYIPEDSTATDQPLKHKLISSNTLADISPSRGNSLLVRSVDSRSAKTKADNESSKKCLNGRSGTLQRSKPQDELNSTVDSAQTGVKINLDVSPKEGPKRLSQPLTHSEDIIPEYVPQCTEYFTDTDGTGVEKSSTSIKTTPNYCQLRIHEAENWANRNDLDSLKYQDTTNEESVLESEEDSFIQQITSRSPAKPVPRVDDPVEALDKIEEALEALDEVAKVELLVKRIKHPNRQSPKANNVSSTSPQKGFNSLRRSKTMNPTVSSRNFSEPIGLSHRASRTSVTGPNLSRATILSKVADSPSSITTPVISQHTQRRSTIQPTSANPIKSTKPLTRPNFELPGEAVARKIKQQRENRIALRQSCHHEYQAAASNPKSSFPMGKPRNLKTRPSKNQVITSSKNQVSPKTGMHTPEVPDLRAKGFTNLSIHRSSTATPAVSHVNRDSANSEKSSNLSAMGPQISNTETSSLQPTNGSVKNLALPLSKSKEPELSNPSKSIKELSNASASNARNEAAERGRHAILKWAEEQMMKR
ncbi:BgTH12-03630 [Blumeria graminis f. sp. triticale]|uniref:BgTH12-03630 n=1 Tax=Blumeria graminis f. sp. triticale TaxID=1689686 RepID=A0A9W4CVH9_BLUGR|nr:BgTH12-03630 [Blumeria graminis f. sp. triticale]